MELYCSVSSSLPANTKAILGCYKSVNYTLDLSDTTPENLTIVTNFVNTIGKHISVSLLNYPGDDQFDTSIILDDQDIDLEIVTIDYGSLDSTEKNSVNAYVALVDTLITPQNS
jgi:hypothetical protein